MKTGTYKEMDINEYHSDNCILSSTGLKKAIRSSREFAYYLVYGQESKPEFDFGNAFEIALIDKINGTDLFNKEVAIMPTGKWVEKALQKKPELKSPKASKIYKDLKSEFDQQNANKYILPDVGDESYETLKMMVDSAMIDKTIVKLLSNTEYQLSFVWEDENGLKCKTRPDTAKLNKKVILDIKTCQDASPKAFFRDMAKFDYPIQACMQIDGAISSGYFDEVEEYFWLAVEKKEPYNAQLYRFQKDDIAWSFDSYSYYKTRAAKVIKEIMNGKKPEQFPGYTENADNKYGIIDVEIPLWYKVGPQNC